MQLVAVLNNKFFRAISTTEDEIEMQKEVMLQDKEGLEFLVMTDEGFDERLSKQ